MTSPVEHWKVLQNGPLAAVDDALSMSLSLDDLPDLPGARLAAADDDGDDLPGQLLEWSEDAELRSIRFSSDDPIVIEFPAAESQPPSEPLS
ncbi:MAG: hypothetical protein ACJ8IK_00905 [Burkholderiaceae bacterium]